MISTRPSSSGTFGVPSSLSFETPPVAVCVAHLLIGAIYLAIVYLLVRDHTERQRWAAMQGGVVAWILVLAAMVPYFNYATELRGRSLWTDLVLLFGIAFPIALYALAPYLAIRWLRDEEDGG